MKLKDLIEDLYQLRPDCKRINIYYHADLYDAFTGECFDPDEFVGVASYHDGYLDTTEDPDGWSLDDEIVSFKAYKQTEEEKDNCIYSISVNLGRWS